MILLLLACVPFHLWTIYQGLIYKKYLQDVQAFELHKKIKAEFENWVQDTSAGGFHQIDGIPYRLEEDELGYYISKNVSYYSFGTHGQESTLFGGSYRLNYKINIGLGRSKSKDFRAFRHLDDGSLVITNKRILFVGTHENISLSLSSILEVINNFTDIEIATSERSGNVMFSDIENALIATSILEGLIEVVRA